MGKKPDDARQTAAADRGKGRVTAAQVAEYLRQHPEFLVRHPDLLDIQIVPGRRKAEGVVDLQQFMVERLRRDVQRMVNQGRNVFGACMVAAGDADGLVTGITRRFPECYADVTRDHLLRRVYALAAIAAAQPGAVAVTRAGRLARNDRTGKVTPYLTQESAR